MTKHELAAGVWREMKGELVARGIYDDAAMLIARGLIDGMMVAAIENTFIAAVAAVDRENEDRLCQVDKAQINVNKPDDGRRMRVDCSAFTLGDGHAVIRSGEELVVRERGGQVFITKRLEG